MEIVYYGLTVLVAIFIALGSLGKKYSNAYTQREKFLNIAIFSLIIAVLMWIVYAFSGESINKTVVLYAAAFGANFVIYNFVLYAAMELGSLSKTNLVNALSLVLPTLAGVIFWNEPFNIWMLLIAMGLMVASLMLIILKSDNESENEGNKKFASEKKANAKWIVFSFLAFLTNGLSCIIQNAEQRHMIGEGVFSMTALSFSFAGIFAFLVYVVYCLINRGQSLKADFHALAHNKLSLLYNVLGLGLVNFTVTFLATRVPAAFLYPCALGGSVIVATVFSAIFLKEKMNWRGVVGIVAGVISIVIFSL